MAIQRVKNQGDGKRRQSPVKSSIDLRVLWKVNLRIGPRKDSFLYRSTEEFELAALTAEVILQSSPGAEMMGAVITGIERQARLWN
jgi:hypothetical protein